MSRFPASKVYLALALTFSAMFGGSTPLVCASTIYVSIEGGSSGSKFGSFDTTTGAFTAIATSGLVSNESPRGLTWDESLGAFQTTLSTDELSTITTSGAVGSARRPDCPRDEWCSWLLWYRDHGVTWPSVHVREWSWSRLPVGNHESWNGGVVYRFE